MRENDTTEFQAFRRKAVEFMLDRDWKRKTGKQKHGINQSLFDHTLVVLDSLIALLPLLRGTYSPGLTAEEERLVLTSAVVHDVGKELDEWQRYVRGERGFLSDVNRRLAEEIVPQIARELASDDMTSSVCEVVNEILSGVLLHMKHERTPANVMDRVLFGGHTNPRWRTLAELVVVGDNLASANGLFEGLRCLEQCSMASHIRTSYHLVQFRGVSTTLLHRAAIDAFVESSWSPVLHYSNGTIYAASARDQKHEPSSEIIEQYLSKSIKAAMPASLASLVVGNPLQSMIPKPDLFDYRDLRECLRVAASRVKRANFAKKPEADRRRVVTAYRALKGDPENVSSETLALESSRIASAHPEMCVFKFFKAALDSKLIGSQITKAATEAYQSPTAVGEKPKKKTVEDVAKAEYDRTFGEGAFSDLQGTSTLMPARDMALTIDRFWSLPGNQFGLDIEKLEFLLDHAKRESILIDALGEVGDKVFDALPDETRPVRASSDDIAKSFLPDLVHPSPSNSVVDASGQIMAYGQTKKNARRSKDAHLCPICNGTFDGGTVAKADFLANPESHTNRAVSHGSAGYIVICNACKFERFLQQLLLGSQVEDVIVLFPRMNIGHAAGEVLRQKAAAIWDAALNRMSEANTEPDQHITLALTHCLARKLCDADVYRLSPAEIVGVLTYESAAETKKKQRKELEAKLRETYDTDELTVELLNEMWVTEFTTLDGAFEALIAGQVTDDDARKARAVAFRLTPQLRICCQTPHMILVPLTNPIAMSKESDVNAGLRELYVTLLLGMSLDCTVAVLRVGEVVTFHGGEGVARVPPVPALRKLVGSEWISVDDSKKWFDAVGAAALLAGSTAFPERSNLYAILGSPTPGHILRRIEQKSDSGQAQWEHFCLLETVRKVMP
jgi:hypothetical protein